MAEIVNLNAVRKAKAKATAKQKADANAAKHGRTKALMALEKARADKSERDLDGKQRDSEAGAE
jgi:Domain of unknown function (DUF4169)